MSKVFRMHWSLPRVASSKNIAAVIATIVPIAFAGIACGMLYQDRLAITASAAQQANNIATILQNDIEHVITSADAALNDVKLGLPLIRKQVFSPEVQRLILFDSVMRQSDYGSVLVLNERGIATFDSRSAVPRDHDFTKQDWFKIHRSNPDAGLVIGLNPHSMSNLPILTFSRGLKNNDGSFGGVVVTVVQISLFKQMFDSLHLGPKDDVFLRTTTGRSIYRRSSGAATFDDDISSNKLFLATQEHQSLTIPALADDESGERLFAYHRLGSLPLAVVVGLATDEIYAAWWSEVWTVGITVILLIILTNLLAIRLRRELRRRERAESEVRESELKFRLFADNASDMISRVNLEGERDYVSPSAERLLGVAPERLLGTEIWRYIDPVDKPVLAVMAENMRGSSGSISTCFRVLRFNGERRWVEAVARPIICPISGVPSGYISAWRDITDRKQAEMLLGESESRYRALADNAADVIVCLDMKLRRTYVSPSAMAVFGYEPEKLLGIMAGDIVHPDEQEQVGLIFQRLVSGESGRETLTCRIRHRLGHYTWVEGRLSVIRGSETGLPSSIMCALRDISENKAQEEALKTANVGLERLSGRLSKARDAAEQANGAKSRFLANISHELRTPLNGILGYTQLLDIEGGLTPKQASRVKIMLSAGKHLLEMINVVLDISEIEAGHFQLRPVLSDIQHIAASSLDLIRPASDSKNLQLSLRLGKGLPEKIVVDPTRLRQIILNLLGNAIKYTETGTVELVIRQARQARLRVEVIDTGPGIPKAQQKLLFQDFERLGADTTLNVEGAGVGLALSRRLANVMGGSMGYEENPVGGSIFWFELSLETDANAAQAEIPASQHSSPERRLASLSVLVVDDVAVNRDVTASFLLAAGHRPTCVSSGEEAVRLAESMNLDLVLMDVRMPGIGGLEATRRIRALGGRAGRVPIVALTAQAFAEEIGACRAAGMNAHLTKPVTQSPLRSMLDEVCGASGELIVQEPTSGMEQTADLETETSDGLPVVDLDVFQQTVDTLPAKKVEAHLLGLIKRTELLISLLSAGDDAAQDGEDVASVAHSIVGSAGVFGFPYLAMVSRNFEVAVRYQPADVPQMTISLRTAAEASLMQMDKCAARLVKTAGRQLLVSPAIATAI